MVHNTDNFAEGADAHAHALAQCRKNFQDMSAHYYVDDKEIIYQAADICRGCWHVGIDYGGELFGIVNNRNSIGIEMCVQKGYDFEKAFENTVLLVKYLMNRTGIKADRVVQHYDVCLKNCPSEIRRHGAWERLKSEIEKEILIPKTGTYRITAKVLNIRSGPGRQYTIVGEVHFGEAYTIVQTENNCWGKLLSGAGWICLNYAERRCSAATTLLKRPADAALSQGIWAVLAVFLLIYIVKSNERFSARQEEREKQYQELLSALTEKFNVLSVIERDITEVKEYIMADTKEINKKI